MRRLTSAILLISTAAIAYEILLMRMLSIVQWHHFAWMVISLALLGYGASGTAIAIGKSWLQNRFDTVFSVNALMFSITMVVCFMLGQRVPFDALEVVWDSRQFGFLAIMYLVFMLPFFFAASCIGLAFTCQPGRIDRIYLADLLGAGTGAALVVLLLFALRPQQVLVVLAAIALLASMSAGPIFDPRRQLPWFQVAWAITLLLTGPSGLFDLQVSEFKGLSQALQTVGAKTLTERSSPLGQLTVVENHRVPFRYAPGLSLATRHVPPDQLAVFTDADGISVISRWDGRFETIAYLGDVTAALPYHLLAAPRVLVLGAGGGTDVLQAIYHKAATIDAVELDPQMIGLVGETFAGFAGHIYDRERVRVHAAEARGFISRSSEHYDLIQLGLFDSLAAAGAGVQALNENYLYTVDAMQEYLRHLNPDGMLAITRWLKIPPRDSLKLVATAGAAMRGMGVAAPERRLAMIRAWNTTTMLVKNGSFDDEDIAAIRDFARRRSFDVVYYPAMPAAEANRYNRLEQAYFHQAVVALLGPDSASFIRRYKFNIEAATDERPYFFNFFKWSVLPEVLSLRERGGAALIEWGYLVPAATLVQAGIAGSALILLPLAWFGRRRPGSADLRAGLYFFILGLAFLFIEMAFIQKFILFLSHPLYSIAVILSSFLIFAGIGSGLSAKLDHAAAAAGRCAVRIAIGCIAVISIAYAAALPTLFQLMIGVADPVKICLSLALVAPLAFFMGMPFPLGLKQLALKAPDFIPWAWGINGFASVVSTALAILLAIEFGFTAVLLLALLLYACAAVVAHF